MCCRQRSVCPSRLHRNMSLARCSLVFMYDAHDVGTLTLPADVAFALTDGIADNVCVPARQARFLSGG